MLVRTADSIEASKIKEFRNFGFFFFEGKEDSKGGVGVLSCGNSENFVIFRKLLAS